MSSHFTAPLLGFDNVIKVVEGVSWRILCDELLGHLFTETEDGDWMKISEGIQAKHQSDKTCLKAVVEKFLIDDRCSWRMLIWSLYKSNHIGHAEHIRSYAEPVKGVLSRKLKFSNNTIVSRLSGKRLTITLDFQCTGRLPGILGGAYHV